MASRQSLPDAGKALGLIGDDSPEALERRRAAKNAQAERAEQDGKPVYGTRRFSAPAYLQYELTRFKLDFAEPCERSVHWYLPGFHRCTDPRLV